ncbi:MAG: hypothetical protein Q8M31_04020 [Beijerinckiaceae bacterium]|nr:hypothetical protein [Beijerinckiaceae bacterium]
MAAKQGLKPPDQSLVFRESVRVFAEAMQAFVDQVLINEAVDVVKMKSDERASHMARVKASAEMQRDAAVSLMRNAFKLEK